MQYSMFNYKYKYNIVMFLFYRKQRKCINKNKDGNRLRNDKLSFNQLKMENERKGQPSV